MCVPVCKQRTFCMCVYVKCCEARWRDGLTVEYRDVGCTSLCKIRIVTAFSFTGNCLFSVHKRKHELKIDVKYRQ
jgi:hypothetical protein